MGEREAQPFGRGARRREALRRVGLRQVDQAPVVAEILREELRMAIEAEAADHQPVEMAQQEIGDVERAGLVVGERREALRCRRRTRSNARRGCARRSPPTAPRRARRRCRNRRRRRRSTRTGRGWRESSRARRRECARGWLCRSAGRHCTSRCGQAFARRNAAISRASAPQAITSTRLATHARAGRSRRHRSAKHSGRAAGAAHQPVTRAARRAAISDLAVSTAIAASRQ